MLLIPTAEGAACNPLVMPYATKGWWPYRDMPVYSAQSWNGQLYFGTPDGRLCWHTGYIDGVQLADPTAYSPIRFSCLTGFSNLGSARNKRVHLTRPTVLAQAPNTVVQATPRYRFETTEPTAPGTAAATGVTNVFDVAIWDADVWGGDFIPIDRFSNAGGVGRDVAIAIRGSAVSRTVIASIDVMYEEGGFL
jgi:hypothetical protein